MYMSATEYPQIFISKSGNTWHGSSVISPVMETLLLATHTWACLLEDMLYVDPYEDGSRTPYLPRFPAVSEQLVG